MDKKSVEMMEKIMDTERMGYAYVYPSDGGAMGEGNPMEEYLIATTPENLAVFVSGHRDAHRITVTDIADRLILDIGGGFINGSPGPGICTKIINRLEKSRPGRWQPGRSSSLTEVSRMHILRRRTGRQPWRNTAWSLDDVKDCLQESKTAEIF